MTSSEKTSPESLDPIAGPSPEAKPGTEPESNLQTGSDRETEPARQTGSGQETQPDHQTGSDPAAEPNLESHPDPEAEPDAESCAGPESRVPQQSAGPSKDGAPVAAVAPSRAVAHILAWSIAALSAFAYVLYSQLQWKTFATPSWDLGIFTELAKQYSQFDAPTVDIKGPEFNLLGDHFHPLLVLLGPVYKLFPSGLTLLVLQDLLFALGSVPITLLAVKRLGKSLGAVVGIGYAMSWGLWSAVESQFHEIAFAVPLLAYGLARWLDTKGNSRSALVAVGLLVFVKEDLGLTVCAVGLVFLWQAWGAAARTDDRFAIRSRASLKKALSSPQGKAGARLAAWGLAWTLLAILVILPIFNPEGGWEYTNRLAQNDAVASNFLLRFFLPATKYATLLLLALATGLVGLVSPYVWIMLPTLFWRFAGNVEHYWGWHWHYSAILMPIAAIALIDACSRWRGTYRARLAAACVALASNVGVAWFGPIGQLVDGRTPFSVSEEQARAGRDAVEALGTGHNVVANLPMLAYNVPGNRVYWEGTYGKAKIDAVIFAPSNSTGGLPADVWAEQKFGGRWKLVYSRLNYQVAVRQ